MAYIGKQPVVGNFVKLDAITTSATATYNLLNGGVAYFPQTANNCIVSLNGVIQSPTSAYTISGSTIVFSDALTSSDSIDFILVLGDVLSIGTPSDGTVTNAKLALTAGSAGTPTISPAADTNTGIFFPAADTIGFAEGGTEVMRIDSSGNLLIGTTTAGSKGISLSADFNIGYAQGTGESVPNIFRQTSSAATVIGNGIRHSTTSNGFASSYSPSFAKTAIALNEGTIRFYSDGATAVAAGTDLTPTERMRIDSSGGLAVGKTGSALATDGAYIDKFGNEMVVNSGLLLIRKSR
jgi:hypothetical protein